ncbi:MAG: hypothetical protein DI586_09725 [Micavibrio aeruginosavorus]|uniref:Glycosyl transferase family 1 domain-containing protein n=1 Tax=Micavibrio aeruginosavorus TaxID=349221 RepID=A0A2W5FGT4_9BACT|nr:MAG: hypothetical protein DI586_09725 [Micavibrio aeruginosavorus]
MKILYVTPGQIPSQAANSVHVMKMAQAFAANGQDVTLAYASTANVSKEEIYSHYNVDQTFSLCRFSLNSGPLSRFYFSLRIAIKAKTKNFNFVFSRCIPSSYFSLLFGNLSFLEIHESPNAFNKIARFMFERIIRHKNFLGLIVISASLEKHVLEITNLSPNKVLTLHDGADIHEDLKPEEFEYGTGYDCQIGYTGHLYKGRGIENIIYLAKELPDCFFHIIGGRTEDIYFWTEQAGHLKNIHFYGHLPHARISRYTAAFDILLAPYQRKVSVSGNKGDTAAWMSPLKIFEYMSAGKPIICSDISVLKEVMNDQKNCLLCPPEDFLAWKESVQLLRNDTNLSFRLGNTAKKDLIEKYTWTARAKKILNYYINFLK